MTIEHFANPNGGFGNDRSGLDNVRLLGVPELSRVVLGEAAEIAVRRRLCRVTGRP